LDLSCEALALDTAILSNSSDKAGSPHTDGRYLKTLCKQNKRLNEIRAEVDKTLKLFMAFN